MAKLEKMKVSPCEMFRKETDKYSQFDETVISHILFTHCISPSHPNVYWFRFVFLVLSEVNVPVVCFCHRVSPLMMLKGRSWAKVWPRSCVSSTRPRRSYTMSIFRWTKTATECGFFFFFFLQIVQTIHPTEYCRINVKARDAGSSFVSWLSVSDQKTTKIKLQMTHFVQGEFQNDG